MSARDIAQDLYNALKGGRKSFATKPKDQNTRDATEPKSIGELLNELVQERDWKSGLSEGEVFVKWKEIVGADIAANTEPIEIKEEKLIVKCASTAWATQLNLIKLQLLQSIQNIAPNINSLEIIGPNSPSWRKGLRTIKGAKGPREIGRAHV